MDSKSCDSTSSRLIISTAFLAMDNMWLSLDEPNDDDDDDDDDPVLPDKEEEPEPAPKQHRARRAAEGVGPETKPGPTSWIQRLLQTHAELCGESKKQSTTLIVESACTGMATHAVALEARSRGGGSSKTNLASKFWCSDHLDFPPLFTLTRCVASS